MSHYHIYNILGIQPDREIVQLRMMKIFGFTFPIVGISTKLYKWDRRGKLAKLLPEALKTISKHSGKMGWMSIALSSNYPKKLTKFQR